MHFPVRAITLDLDDTLWPIGPAIVRAEERLDAWLRAHAPATAARWPVAAMRELRNRMAEDNPHLAHDYTEQRRLCLRHALREAGDDEAHAQAAFDVFFDARNEVECYADSVAALERLAAHVPVAALTNGNADLHRIGLAGHFAFYLGAREHGAAKPSACIFHAACARLEVAPDEVLHVGDDIDLDIVGAAQAGLRTCWINRRDDTGQLRRWPHADADAAQQDVRPDLEFDSLAALADWLDRNLRVTHSAT
jgi:FMN hydrolase / 5-amino-6-(5-phospho-D-ribitylamino)uracil phosphatase